MEQADRATQNILGTFERLHESMSRTFNFNPTFKGLDKMTVDQPTMNPMTLKPMTLELKADSAYKELENLTSQVDVLENEINDVGSALVEAFNANNTQGIEALQKEYMSLYDELARVESKAVQAGERLANLELKRLNIKEGPTGINDPPATRVAMLEARMNTQPAETAFSRLKSTIMNTNLNPFQDVGKHGQQSALTIGNVIEGVKSKIADMQSFNNGVAQNIRSRLSEAFNHVPLVNTLSNSVDSLKQRLSSTETSSVLLGNSFARGAHEGQKLSLVDRVLQGIGQGADNVARKILGIKRSQDQVNQSMSRVERNAKSYTRMGSIIARMRSGMTSFTQAINGSYTGSNRLLNSLNKLPNPINKAISAAQNLKARLSESVKSGGALNTIANLMKFQVAIQALRTMSNLMSGLTDKADNYIQTMNRLNIANDGSEALGQFNDKILASAIRSRTAYGEVSETVARLAINAKDAFSNNDEAITFAENLNKLYKISGATLAEQQGSMIQLTQAMARGTLRGEELNSVWEQGPLIIQKIADHLGITQGELKAMADEGQITADIVKSALLAATDDINEQFSQMDFTFGQMVQNFKTYAIGAFQPLIESWNNFVNSVEGQLIFEGLTQALFTVATIANWAFNQILVPAIQWAIENIEMLKIGFIVVGTIAAGAALVAAAAWAIAHWQMMLIIAGVAMVIYALNQMGFTAGEVGGYIAYVAVFIATAFYDAAMVIAGVIYALVTYMMNTFKYFANMIISVAEFFVNVWRHPVHAVRQLFYNVVDTILGYWDSFISGTSKAAQAIGDMFVAGVNIAIKAVNGLISMLNKIPGVNIGTVGAFASGGSVGGGGGGGARGGGLDEGPSLPDTYVSLTRFEYDSIPDAYSVFGDKLVNPHEKAINAFTATRDTIDGMGNGFNEFMDRMNGANASQSDFVKGLGDLYDPNNFGGGGDGNGGGGSGGKGKGGAGKKPNVGTVDKVKDEVDISNEDLKYLRDIAERNFVIKYEKIEPSATVNFESTGNTEEDARRILEMMEQMIKEQSAQGLYTD